MKGSSLLKQVIVARYGCCPASGLKFGERMRSGVATKNWQLSDHNKANRRACCSQLTNITLITKVGLEPAV